MKKSSPIFAAESQNEKGEPVLVMYEYERKRGVAYSVKATLARDVLLIHVDIQNQKDTPTWMYWWSNIAVDETDGSRVLVPARQSYTFNRREDGVTVVDAEDTPYIDGWDSSYPATHKRARDFFYRIDPAQPKWEANVDKNGRGMVQFSTPELVGRKLFVWGAASQGGKNWNRWLSHGDTRYTEIQAGLLRSQMEQCQMPAHSAYHWTEGYTACSGDPTILHGADYDAANRLVEDSLRDKYPLLTDGYFQLVGTAKLKHFGSGWGALEEELRGQRLSAVRDMAAEAGVNPNTMQRAFQELERQGLVYTQRSSGRYVTEDMTVIENTKQALARENIKSFMDSMRRIGYSREEIIRLLESSEREDTEK